MVGCAQTYPHALDAFQAFLDRGADAVPHVQALPAHVRDSLARYIQKRLQVRLRDTNTRQCVCVCVCVSVFPCECLRVSLYLLCVRM